MRKNQPGRKPKKTCPRFAFMSRKVDFCAKANEIKQKKLRIYSHFCHISSVDIFYVCLNFTRRNSFSSRFYFALFSNQNRNAAALVHFPFYIFAKVMQETQERKNKKSFVFSE